MLARIFFSIGVVIVGFLAPYWLFIFLLFLGAVLFSNFWEAILVSVIINSVYVYSGASFEGVYVVWGIVVYIVNILIHRQTRFQTYILNRQKN